MRGLKAVDVVIGAEISEAIDNKEFIEAAQMNSKRLWGQMSTSILRRLDVEHWELIIDRVYKYIMDNEFSVLDVFTPTHLESYSWENKLARLQEACAIAERLLLRYIEKARSEVC